MNSPTPGINDNFIMLFKSKLITSNNFIVLSAGQTVIIFSSEGVKDSEETGPAWARKCFRNSIS